MHPTYHLTSDSSLSVAPKKTEKTLLFKTLSYRCTDGRTTSISTRTHSPMGVDHLTRMKQSNRLNEGPSDICGRLSPHILLTHTHAPHRMSAQPPSLCVCSYPSKGTRLNGSSLSSVAAIKLALQQMVPTHTLHTHGHARVLCSWHTHPPTHIHVGLRVLQEYAAHLASAEGDGHHISIAALQGPWLTYTHTRMAALAADIPVSGLPSWVRQRKRCRQRRSKWCCRTACGTCRPRQCTEWRHT